MKNLYICEKCGKSFEDYNEAFACENGHVELHELSFYNFEEELKPMLTYKAGIRYPEKLYFPVEIWNPDGENKKTVAVYKLEKEMESEKSEKLWAAHDERVERENREWQERYEAEKAARAAKEKEAAAV